MVVNRDRTLYKVYINPDVDLRYYLTETYKNDLKKAANGDSYKNLINMYGTHVLCCAVMGGTADYNVTTDYSYNLIEEKSKNDVVVGFNMYFGGAKLNIETSKTETSSEYRRSVIEKATLRPSESTTGGKDKWVANLNEKTATMIDFQDDANAGSVGLKIYL